MSISKAKKRRADQIEARLRKQFPGVFVVGVYYDEDGWLRIFLRPEDGGPSYSNVYGLHNDHRTVADMSEMLVRWVRSVLPQNEWGIEVKQVQCCCRMGAAVRGELPEFSCPQCPVHHGGAFSDPRDLCRRHRSPSAAPAAPGDAPGNSGGPLSTEERDRAYRRLAGRWSYEEMAAWPDDELRQMLDAAGEDIR